MSKLEWQAFFASNTTMILSYWGIPKMWQKVNEAQTSFVAELYYIPIGLMVMGCIFALLMDYEILKGLLRKGGAR